MSRQNDLMTISVDDVVHTLRERQRDWKYNGRFQPMLAFASDLTGISEDGLMELMDVERGLEGKLDDNFLLSEDTDFGCDLMMFISDWREDLDFSRDDLQMVRENSCFGLIALRVEGYFIQADCSLADIDFGKFSADERVMDLVHLIGKAYRDYLAGDYSQIAVDGFVADYRLAKSLTVGSVLEDAQERIGASEAGKLIMEKEK